MYHLTGSLSIFREIPGIGDFFSFENQLAASILDFFSRKYLQNTSKYYLCTPLKERNINPKG